MFRFDDRGRRNSRPRWRIRGGQIADRSAVIGLLDPPGRICGGEIRLEGQRIDDLAGGDARIRGKNIGTIFQDPLTSLDPLHRIGDQLIETIRSHLPLDEAAARARAIASAGRSRASRRCRAACAHGRTNFPAACASVSSSRWRSPGPQLLIADEPTTALDVSVQAQIIALLKRFPASRTSVLLVTHDMGVIAEAADRVAVMYAGQLVEVGKTRMLIGHPRHPYTRGLMDQSQALHVRPLACCKFPAPCQASRLCRRAARFIHAVVSASRNAWRIVRPCKLKERAPSLAGCRRPRSTRRERA